MLDLLADLVPDGLHYGTSYLVEFSPSSLWYETSLTLATKAVQRGIKFEYHVFQHAPSEILRSFERLGLETQRLLALDRLRIIDSYTPSTKLGRGLDVPHSESWKGRQAFDLGVWAENIRNEILKGIAPPDMRWMHIDDNTSVLLQLFREDEVVDFYRTSIIPWSRARELLMFWSVVKDVAPAALYRKLEALCDGVIDFESREEEGEIRHYMRLRHAMGKISDTHWRELKMQEDGNILFITGSRPEGFKFKRIAAGRLFDYLTDAFIEDSMVKNINSEKSGWRTLVDISKGTGLSTTILYSQFAKSGTIFRELAKRGIIETRHFPGERGRGGNVTRIRVAYGKEPVKEFVNERAKNPAKKGPAGLQAPSDD